MFSLVRIRLLKQTRQGMPKWVLDVSPEYAEALVNDGKAEVVPAETPLFSDKSMTKSRTIATKILRPPMGGLDAKGSD